MEVSPVVFFDGSLWFQGICYYSYTLKNYLDDIAKAWGIDLVDSAEQADVVVSLGKAKDSGAIDMLEENFFLGK